MATNDGKRAVSAENAKKMFSDISAEIIDRTSREVLYTGTENDAMFMCPTSEYSQIYIEISFTYGFKTQTLTVPIQNATYPINLNGTERLEVVIYDNSDVVQVRFINNPNGYTVLRVVGIRNGGGQLLTELSNLLHLLESGVE